jgi:hypothetical protein
MSAAHRWQASSRHQHACLLCPAMCPLLRLPVLRQGWLNIDFAREVRLERKLGEGGFGQVRASVYDYACYNSGYACSWRIIVCFSKLKQIEYQHVLVLAANMLCKAPGTAFRANTRSPALFQEHAILMHNACSAISSLCPC